MTYRYYVTTNCFFLLSSSSDQGIALATPEMPEMDRYALSEAQPWRLFLLETQNSTLEVLTKAASEPEGRCGRLLLRRNPKVGIVVDRLMDERPSLSGPTESSFESRIKTSTTAELQKKHIFPFLTFLESHGRSPGR